MPEEKNVTSRPGARWSPGAEPTGSELVVEGSSVITDSDVATAEDIPETEEIFERAERRKKGEDLPYMHPAGPHAPSGGAAGGASPTVDESEQPSEEKRKPHEMYEEGAWEKGE